jgi:hypothetical protein
MNLHFQVGDVKHVDILLLPSCNPYKESELSRPCVNKKKALSTKMVSGRALVSGAWDGGRQGDGGRDEAYPIFQ